MSDQTMRIGGRALREIRQRNLDAGPTTVFADVIERHKEHAPRILKEATVTDCLANGYAPAGYGVADFAIIHRGGVYHLFHIPRTPGCKGMWTGQEHWFAHAVSEDLDTWRTLDPVLSVRADLPWETAHLWAPYVWDAGDRCHMFYTALDGEIAQVLCRAESTDGDLRTWTRASDNPIVPYGGFDWHWTNPSGHVRHARDPHVTRVDGHYMLTYTAMHKSGCPAVGAMVSDDLIAWEDAGPILYRDLATAKWFPESVNVQSLPDGRWALIPSKSPGLSYHLASDPLDWHGSKPTLIDYADGPQGAPTAMEVMARDDDRGAWLVAFFEEPNNRLFIGELNVAGDPWTLRRLRDREALEGWPVSQ